MADSRKSTPISVRHRLEWLAFRFAIGTLAIPPLPAANILGRLYGSLLYRAAGKARRVAFRNLELAGFADRDRIAPGAFHSLGRLLVSFARFPKLSALDISSYLRWEGAENLEAAYRRGHGVLIVTAHLGNWELLGMAAGYRYHSLGLHVVIRPLENPLIDAFVERHRALSGNSLHVKWGSARQVVRALESGALVAVYVDRNTLPLEGVFIDFFGHKACSGTAAARMAKLTGGAVVPVYAVWSETERRYVAYVEPEVPMTGDVVEDTQRIHARIEAAIRRFPDQWLWTQKRWKTRPPGEQPLY
jgi:KDO2-lipid IV(A) lauroyltransferase